MTPGRPPPGAAGNLRLDVSHAGDAAEVTVIGDLDQLSVPALRECLLDLHRSGCRRVVLDVRAVSFMDSAGVGILAAGWKRFHDSGGELRLVGPSLAVRKVLDVTGLATMLGVDD